MASTESLQEQKKRLQLRLDASRQSVATGTRDLQVRLSPTRALKAHFRRHPLHLFGMTMAGVASLTTLLRSAKRLRKKRRSFKRILFGLAFDLAKPALRLWALDQARAYIHSQHTKRQTDSLLGP